MSRRRSYPVHSLDPFNLEVTGRIGNLGSNFVVSGLDGVTVSRPTAHGGEDPVEGVYKLDLVNHAYEIVDARADMLLPVTASGLYGASFEVGSNVRDVGDLYLHVWKDAFRYHVELTGAEVAVRLLLRRKAGLSGSTA